MTGVAPIPPIELAIEIAASPEAAWRAITDPDRVALWLTEATVVGLPGSPYRLDFGDGSVVTGVVTELEPGSRFAHTWAWADGDGAGPTRVEWRVEPRPGGGTRISLVHDGWAKAGSHLGARDDHERYWTGYLDDLQDVLGET